MRVRLRVRVLVRVRVRVRVRLRLRLRLRMCACVCMRKETQNSDFMGASFEWQQQGMFFLCKNNAWMDSEYE